MKKTIKIRKPFYVLLMPLLMATQCGDDDDCSGFAELDGFSITIENTQPSYNVDETIWFDAKASSMLANECDENEIDIVTDAELFRDSFFVLKLVDSDTNINAEVASSDVTYDIGTEFNFNSCDEGINVMPVISSDNLEYNFRLGFNFDTPGDYCVVIGRRVSTTFNNSSNVNSNIYEAYNNGENTIKFDSCNTTFTRELNSGVYFFTIQ